jgi:replicative DNA helicase
VLNNQAMLDILPVLRSEDFFLAQHRQIYKSMEDLVSSGSPIDPVSMMDVLGRRGELESAGGAAYLSQLADGLPKVSNVTHYAQIVKEKAVLRNLIYAAGEIQEQAFSGRDDSKLIVERAIEGIFAVAGTSDNVAKIREWKDVALAAVKEAEDAFKNPKAVMRMDSGIQDLDDKLAGLRKKELALIVGGTGHGKSLLAEQFAVHADMCAWKGMIFSAEMTGEQVAARQIAYESDVFFWHLRHPETLTIEYIEKMKTNAKHLERSLAIVDSGITPARIWALCEARKRSTGLDFVVVDYDQLVIQAGMSDDSGSEDDFFAKQAQFVFQAKKFAERLDIAFVLLAQLRKVPRGVKDGGKPSIDDIYGHSAMRNTPHVIMFVVRDFLIKNYDKKYEDQAKVYILKSRNDNTGMVKLNFDKKRVRFLDYVKKASDVFEDGEA